ncbi:TPA: hypothetical protein DCE37_17265 [Candidatus Latescibacteria bacterium]|nr:hypothetical protein [Candidatus Latescibacterota bacterium]|tara:strand:+ start:931 stop:2694 length:1764 start_codon:yes stop_codon:yes gene_type:complete
MPEAVDLFADRWLSSRPTYHTAMDQCIPDSSLAPDDRHRRWRVMEYRGQHLSGKALVAGVETEAPPIALPLDAHGWYAISIGCWRLKDWYLAGDGKPQLLVRMAGDDTYTSLQLPTRPQPTDPVSGWHHWTGEEELSECFWQIVELHGEDLEFAQPTWIETGRDGVQRIKCCLTNVAYVKLLPLTEKDVRVYQQADPAQIPLYAHNDVTLTRAESPEMLRRHILPFGDTDFTRIYWEGAMGDLSSYFRTRNRTPEAIGRDVFFHTHARNEAACWRRWRASGNDPLAIASEVTRHLGLEFHVTHRLGGFRQAPAHDYWDHGDTFCKRHPELRGRDRDGAESVRLSFAYPKVREHVIETYREMAAYEIDGLCLLYNRRHPLLEYEAPLVDGYREQYGADPRTLDEDDPTWLRYRSSILTGFMRELKEALQLPVTAIVMSTPEENLRQSLDPEGWIAAGVVDTLVPYTDHPEWNHSAFSWQQSDAIKPFISLTQTSSCELAPCFHTSEMGAEDYRNTAAGLAQQGVDAFFFWWGDTGSMAHYGPEWSAARRLGRIDEISTWQEAGSSSLDAPVYPLDSLDGWHSKYVTPA